MNNKEETNISKYVERKNELLKKPNLNDEEKLLVAIGYWSEALELTSIENIKNNKEDATKIYDKAFKLLKKALEYNPFLWDAYGAMGDTMLELQRYDEAIKYYEKYMVGLHQAPDEEKQSVPLFILDLAKAYSESGRKSDAISILERTIKELKGKGVRITPTSETEGPTDSFMLLNALESLCKLYIYIADTNKAESIISELTNSGGSSQVKWLEKELYDININNSDRKRIIRYIEDNDIDDLKLLFDKGIDVNLDLIGFTPLHWATTCDKYEIVKYLIKMGADVNKRSRDDANNPLIEASWRGFCDIVKILIDNGANINDADSNGNSALYVAVEGTISNCVTDKDVKRHIETVKILAAKGTNSKSKDKQSHGVLGLINKINNQNLRKTLEDIIK